MDYTINQRTIIERRKKRTVWKSYRNTMNKRRTHQALWNLEGTLR